MQEQHATEFTPAEDVAGFKLVEIDDPRHFQGYPKKIWAVVYRYGKSYRLVKMRHPTRPGITITSRCTPYSRLIRRIGRPSGTRSVPTIGNPIPIRYPKRLHDGLGKILTRITFRATQTK